MTGQDQHTPPGPDESDAPQSSAEKNPSPLPRETTPATSPATTTAATSAAVLADGGASLRRPGAANAFQPDAVEIEENPVAPGPRWTLYAIASFLLIGIIWAAVGQIDKIVSQQAPSGQPRKTSWFNP